MQAEAIPDSEFIGLSQEVLDCVPIGYLYSTEFIPRVGSFFHKKMEALTSTVNLDLLEVEVDIVCVSMTELFSLCNICTLLFVDDEVRALELFDGFAD